MSPLQMDVLSWVAVAVAVGFGATVLAIGGVCLGLAVECWRQPSGSVSPVCQPLLGLY